MLKSVANSQNIAQSLISRGEHILERAITELHRLHSEGKGHLVIEFEREIKQVEHLVNELKTISEGHQWEQQLIHQIEERLLQHENRLAEELVRIASHNDHEPQELHSLIAKAEDLLRRAKHDLEHLYGTGRGHLIHEIQHQTDRIEELVHELRSHPSSHLEAGHAKEILQRLAEHERRLAEELRLVEEHINSLTHQ